MFKPDTELVVFTEDSIIEVTEQERRKAISSEDEARKCGWINRKYFSIDFAFLPDLKDALSYRNTGANKLENKELEYEIKEYIELFYGQYFIESSRYHKPTVIWAGCTFDQLPDHIKSKLMLLGLVFK